MVDFDSVSDDTIVFDRLVFVVSCFVCWILGWLSLLDVATVGGSGWELVIKAAGCVPLGLVIVAIGWNCVLDNIICRSSPTCVI